jgi:hypothetical protein
MADNLFSLDIGVTPADDSYLLNGASDYARLSTTNTFTSDLTVNTTIWCQTLNVHEIIGHSPVSFSSPLELPDGTLLTSTAAFASKADLANYALASSTAGYAAYADSSTYAENSNTLDGYDSTYFVSYTGAINNVDLNAYDNIRKYQGAKHSARIL